MTTQALLSEVFSIQDTPEDEEIVVTTNKRKRKKTISVTQKFLMKIKREPLYDDEDEDQSRMFGPTPRPELKEEDGGTTKRRKTTKVKREGSANSSWNAMSIPDKASALKTYVNRYGKHTISEQLKCIHKNASQGISKLESLTEAISNNVDVLSFAMEKDIPISKSSDAYSSAVEGIVQDILCLREEVIPLLSSFVHEDVHSIEEIQQEIEGFIYEVGEQCDDVLFANPPPPPEEMLNTSLFSVYQSAKSHGRRKSSNTSRVPPNTFKSGVFSTGSMHPGASVLLHQTSGRSGKTSLGKTGSSDRRRRSIGMCPIKSEFCRNLENLFS